MFQLRNPNNPAASTHAGVLEFIADEGVVHLPYWVWRIVISILSTLNNYCVVKDDEDIAFE